jgi:hypothetical protein
MWKMGGVLEISKLFDNLMNMAKEYFDTLKHKTKLSTLFDYFTETVIPNFVSEKDLKKFYEKRMDELNEFIYKL